MAISKQQLAEWERLVQAQNEDEIVFSYAFETYDIIPKLIAEVRELKKELTDAIAKAGTYADFYKEAVRKLSCFDKEADWLAQKAAINCPSSELEDKCAYKPLENDECIKCWREQARKAVKDD